MKWQEISVGFEAEHPDLAMELISDAFYDQGAGGVILGDPRQAPAENWAEEAAPLPKGFGVTGYLPLTADFESRLLALKLRLQEIAQANGVAIRLRETPVDEEDWAESWKAFFKPEKIGRRIVVKPTWHAWEAKAGDLVIEIDPGMAFGTGTHPTTAMCVELLEVYVKPGMRVLDVGTGSGILMAAALLLGAESVRGVDNDPVAVEVARANLVRNGFAENRFNITGGHLLESVEGRFDIVVANILSHVIEALLETVPRVAAPGSLFIGSGIVQENEGRVRSRMAHMGFDLLSVTIRDGWVAVCGKWPKRNG